jgi:hypothetical protein
MKTDQSTVVSLQPSAGTADLSRSRSGAVARMLGMPVATLRVWERRYALTKPELSPSGQRLYSAADVRRLAVVGSALGLRLLRPALLRRLGRPVVLLGPFDDAAQAEAALQGSDVDAWVMQEAHLQEGWLDCIAAAAPALTRVPKAVLYGFAADSVCEALATAGVALLREPQPDAVLAQWLRSLPRVALVPSPKASSPVILADDVPPRRWGDAALADFGSRSSTMACECPRHMAELLVQLSHFEAYSAECEHRHAADAELHAYLRKVAAAARAHFEAALEHVALHEGLILPSAPG